MAPPLGGGGFITSTISYLNGLYCIYYATGHLLQFNNLNAWVDLTPGESNRHAHSLVGFDTFIYRGNTDTGGSGLWKFLQSSGTFELINNNSDDINNIRTLTVFNDKIVGAGTEESPT